MSQFHACKQEEFFGLPIENAPSKLPTENSAALSESEKINTDIAFHCKSRTGDQIVRQIWIRFPKATGKVMGQESFHRLKKTGSNAFLSWLGLVAGNPHMVSPNRLQMAAFNKCSSFWKAGQSQWPLRKSSAVRCGINNPMGETLHSNSVFSHMYSKWTKDPRDAKSTGRKILVSLNLDFNWASHTFNYFQNKR